MRKVKTYPISSSEKVKRKILRSAQKFEQYSVLESNTLSPSRAGLDKYSHLDCIVAVGAHSELIGVGRNDFESLKSYVDKTSDWLFGYLTYDLKNQLEDLKS